MTQDTPSRSLDKVIVRLPDGMRDRIREAAENNNRSMNAEIVDRLEFSLNGVPELSRFADTALASLEEALEDTKRELKHSEYMLSQMKLMRYLLDQVALNNGNLPLDLINVIKIISLHSNSESDEFDLIKLRELLEDVADKAID